MWRGLLGVGADEIRKVALEDSVSLFENAAAKKKGRPAAVSLQGTAGVQ
jgi:hypothetical protein